jgi:hypothetical protein
MSRRGWKSQRAALFADSADAFGTPAPPRATVAAPEAAAPEAELPDDIWGEPPAEPVRVVVAAPAAPLRGIWAEPEDVAPKRSIWAEPEVAPKRHIGSEPDDDAPADDVWAEPGAAPIRDRSATPRSIEPPTEPPAPRPKRARKPWLARREEPLPKDLVGRDLAGAPRRARARRRLPLALLAGAIVAALLLVTLRVEILRLRYAAAEVAAEEEALLERIAQTTVRVRELRDPARLRKLATERGFVRPERVLTVELPARRLPQVAASPPREAKP